MNEFEIRTSKDKELHYGKIFKNGKEIYNTVNSEYKALVRQLIKELTKLT